MAAIVNRTMLAAPKDPLTWDAVFAWIQRDWPEVAQMNTRELAERMAASNEVVPLLIDVRTREEYEVSHLPGAIWAETPNQIASALREASDRRAVVLYCSVGVRSSRAAAKLVRSGRADVFNLQGSIFQWANEGRPLIANDRAVHVVHPYNERWGVLLNPQLHPMGRTDSPLAAWLQPFCSGGNEFFVAAAYLFSDDRLACLSSRP